jgi:hypothetical protein
MSSASVGIRASKPGGAAPGVWPPPTSGAPPGVPVGTFNITSASYWEPGSFDDLDNPLLTGYSPQTLEVGEWVFNKNIITPCSTQDFNTSSLKSVNNGWINNLFNKTWEVYVLANIQSLPCAIPLTFSYGSLFFIGTTLTPWSSVTNSWDNVDLKNYSGLFNPPGDQNPTVFNFSISQEPFNEDAFCEGTNDTSGSNKATFFIDPSDFLNIGVKFVDPGAIIKFLYIGIKEVI